MNEKILTKTNELTKIPITRNTFEKIKAYADISGNNECYGFLLSPLDRNNGIVYNAILAPDQNVSGASARISGEVAAKAKAEIENLGYKAVGFWHSHGSGSAFHSGIDDRNMHKLILSFTGNTEKRDTLKNEGGYFPKQNKIIVRQNNTEFVVEFDKKDLSIKEVDDIYSELTFGGNEKEMFINNGKERIVINRYKKFERRRFLEKSIRNTGIAYSIVVNKSGNYYAEIGVSTWCNVCERLEEKIYGNVGINQLYMGDDIEFTRKQLEKDLEERVKGFRRKRWL